MEIKEESDLRTTFKKLRDKGYEITRSFDAYRLKKDDNHFVEFSFPYGGHEFQKLFAEYPGTDPYEAMADMAHKGLLHVRYNSLSKDFPVPEISTRLKNSYIAKGFAPQVTENIQTTLTSIIEKIEKQRIKKINNLDRFKMGTKVKHQGLLGEVIQISPKRTSILVEFIDKSRKRFFVNKRAKNKTLEELSLQKIIKSMSVEKSK